MRFVKAHAYGNDFLYVDRAAVPLVPLDRLGRLAPEICDRHTGVGADGLIVYERTAGGARMHLFNADGSRAEVSGNGVRALAALLLNDPGTGDMGGSADVNYRGDRLDVALTIQTDAGPKQLTRVARDDARQTFRATMGLPRDLRQLSVQAAEESLPLVVMDFGNPQCVVLGELPTAERFRRVGAALERHPAFPAGTNVEFADVETPGRVRILIWERGVGPTQSSGTGSCAALIAAASFGGARREADVIAPGGAQRVEWRDDSVYLTGWAEVVCVGIWLRALPMG